MTADRAAGGKAPPNQSPRTLRPSRRRARENGPASFDGIRAAAHQPPPVRGAGPGLPGVSASRKPFGAADPVGDRAGLPLEVDVITFGRDPLFDCRVEGGDVGAVAELERARWSPPPAALKAGGGDACRVGVAGGDEHGGRAGAREFVVIHRTALGPGGLCRGSERTLYRRRGRQDRTGRPATGPGEVSQNSIPQDG